MDTTQYVKYFSVKYGIWSYLLFFSYSLYAQERFDIGLFGGTSYYMGDINQTRIFYAPSLSYGAIVNYVFDSRLSLRVEIYKGSFQANDMDFANDYQRLLRRVAFTASLVDMSLQWEFNFLPYINITRYKDNFTFFVANGLGCAFIINSDYDPGSKLTVPIGIGVKYNLIKRLTVGAEWSYRKTFADGIDGVINYRNNLYRSGIHNFDWYSFAGVFFTYKIFYDEGKCPVYLQE